MSSVTPILRKLEFSTVWILWISFYTYCCYQVYLDSQTRKPLYQTHTKSLKSGLLSKYFPNLFYDVQDYEWSQWHQNLKDRIFFLAAHFVTLRTAAKYLKPHRYLNFWNIQLLFGFSFATYFAGIKVISWLILQMIVLQLTVKITKNKACVWMMAIFLIFSISSEKLLNFFDGNLNGYYLVSQSNLRFISFCFDYLDALKMDENEGDSRDEKSEKTDSEKTDSEKTDSEKTDSKKFQFIEHLRYVFYFPIMLTGPWITYDKFYISRSKPTPEWSAEKSKYFGKQLFRFAVCMLMIDFLTSQIYFSIMHIDLNFLKTTSYWTLVGLLFWHVQFFYLKYHILYGMSAKYVEVDGILNCPKGPHCVISRPNHREMWRFFDAGLHEWLLKYVFKPVVKFRGFDSEGSEKRRSSPLQLFIASVASFGFTFFWHVPQMYTFYWVIMSLLGLTIEQIVCNVFLKKVPANVKNSKFLFQWLCAVFGCWSFSWILVTNMYFLGGVDVGHNYLKRIYTEDLWNLLVFKGFLVCGYWCSIGLREKHSAKDKVN